MVTRPGSGYLPGAIARKALGQLHTTNSGGIVIRGLVGLLIVVAVVLFLVKVAVLGGIVGAIALVLLILLVLGRI